MEAVDRELGGIVPGVKFDAAEIRKSVETEQLCERYLEVVTAGTDRAAIDALGRQIAAAEIKDPKILNELAWTILTKEEIKRRDLPLATNLARFAVDVTGGKDGDILDTYARALFDTGQAGEAIKVQKQALGLATDEKTKTMRETALKRYEGLAVEK